MANIFGSMLGGGLALMVPIFGLLIGIILISLVLRPRTFESQLVRDAKQSSRAAQDESKRVNDEILELRQALMDSQVTVQEQRKDLSTLREEYALERDPRQQPKINALQSQVIAIEKDEGRRTKDEVIRLRKALADVKRMRRDTQKELKGAQKHGQPRLSAEANRILMIEQQGVASLRMLEKLGEQELRQTKSGVSAQKKLKKTTTKGAKGKAKDVRKLTAREAKLEMRAARNEQRESTINLELAKAEQGAYQRVMPLLQEAARERKLLLGEEEEAQLLKRFWNNENKYEYAAIKSIQEAEKFLKTLPNLLNTLVRIRHQLESVKHEFKRSNQPNISNRISMLERINSMYNLMGIEISRAIINAEDNKVDAKIISELNNALSLLMEMDRICKYEIKELMKILQTS